MPVLLSYRNQSIHFIIDNGIDNGIDYDLQTNEDFFVFLRNFVVFEILLNLG